jgi:asparagine synthase (glutamine-hydrolysing)
MCGIAGILTPGTAVDSVTLRTMVAAMFHRGPDGSGLWLDNDVGLGMRRLAIVDVAGGEQPLASEDGNIRVVFNGEIYNHEELRSWLSSRGHTLASRTDGEVIAHLYEELGERFVERLNGIFAIAVWDVADRQLVLARDQLGVKPLYLHRSNGGLRFASELKALLCDPRVPRTLDFYALDQHLTFRFTPAPRTLLAGVEKLEPATVLVARDGHITTRRYWDATIAPRPEFSFDAAAEELRERFELAVRRQMMSDRPIGAMLSGGIDSAAVVAMMARMSRRVKTFTVGFEGGGDADETKLARQTAALFGTDHADLVLPASDFARELADIVEWLEEPVATSSAIGFRAVSRLGGASVPVLLSGQGADELLAGYWRYVGEWIASHTLGAVAALRMGAPLARLAEHTASPRLGRGLGAVGHPDTLTRFMNIYAVFTDEEKDKLYRPELRGFLRRSGRHPSHCVERHRARALDRDPLGQMLYVDTRLWLPDDLLLVGDKMSMAESVEMRVPFLDRDLVEYVESLPAGHKLRFGQRKAVFRQAMRGVLPAGIIHRKERGFATPVGRWLRDDLQDEAKRVLLEAPTIGRNLFDLGYVESLIEQHRRWTDDHTRKLFCLMSLEHWAARFLGAPPFRPGTP